MKLGKGVNDKKILMIGRIFGLILATTAWIAGPVLVKVAP